MTFDDGIVKIYKVKQGEEPGKKPKKKLVLKSEHYFGYSEVYHNRYYEAKGQQDQIDELIHIWQDRDITTKDIAEDEEGKQFRIVQVQHGENEEGLRASYLSLERLDEKYELAEN